MADAETVSGPAVFEGSLVNLKNSPTHKSVVLQIEVPEEYGEVIVRAFGWPTRVKPLPVAVARLEAAGEQPERAPEPPAEPRPFERLSPAEQAGILCKEPEFEEFLKTLPAYRALTEAFGPDFGPADFVRETCGVKSRAEILPDTEAERQWRILYKRFRRWQDERDRLDVDF